jgi:hypothetical protein
MVTKIPVALGVEIVLPHDECGYAGVLDSMPDAE